MDMARNSQWYFDRVREVLELLKGFKQSQKIQDTALAPHIAIGQFNFLGGRGVISVQFLAAKSRRKARIKGALNQSYGTIPPSTILNLTRLGSWGFVTWLV